MIREVFQRKRERDDNNIRLHHGAERKTVGFNNTDRDGECCEL